MTKEEFLKKFENFPMTCEGCEKEASECLSMGMCIFIRNKIKEYTASTNTSTHLKNLNKE